MARAPPNPTRRLRHVDQAVTHGPFVIVEKQRRDGRPIRAVSYLEPEADWDSGFAVFPSEPDQVEDDVELVCLDCLLDEEPNIARDLELACEHGEATRHGDTWMPCRNIRVPDQGIPPMSS
jgi:hypothetical protein